MTRSPQWYQWAERSDVRNDALAHLRRSFPDLADEICYAVRLEDPVHKSKAWEDVARTLLPQEAPAHLKEENQEDVRRHPRAWPALLALLTDGWEPPVPEPE